MALDLSPRQGEGTCRREQSKSEGLDLLTLGPPISQKQLKKSLIVLIPVFGVAFILTSVLDLLEHAIGNL